MRKPTITFGIIVLNGEPFTRYNLRAIYPFAYQIIVVEGASPKAAHAATPNGHSIDGTLEVLHRFKAEEDPEDKLLIVTAEDDGHPNGFWPGEKDQQSQAYAHRATGDWLWQIDIDEFYQPEDMARVADYLATHPEVTCLTFSAYHFWGDFDYEVVGGLFLSRKFQGEPWGAYRRVLRWGPGYHYVTHRPPTVADAQGLDITRRHLRCASRIWPDHPVRMYHYLMLITEQFTRKGTYYANMNWSWDRHRDKHNAALLGEITLQNAFSIYDQHGTHNWLTRFVGQHPPQVEQMRVDLTAGHVAGTLRPMQDVERLNADLHYQQLCARYARQERTAEQRNELLYQIWYRPRVAFARWLRAVVPSQVSKRLPQKLRVKLTQNDSKHHAYPPDQHL